MFAFYRDFHLSAVQQKFMKTIQIILFVPLLLSCVSGLVTQQLFLSRLRKKYTGTWEQLGKPVIFLNSGMLNTTNLLRFLWRKNYESLDDAKTIALGRFLRGFLLFYFVLCSLYIGTLVLMAGPHK